MAQDIFAVLSSEIVLGQDVLTHGQSSSNAFRVLVGAFLQGMCMVGVSFRQNDVKVCCRNEIGVRNINLRNVTASRCEASERVFEYSAHISIEMFQKICPRYTKSYFGSY